MIFSIIQTSSSFLHGRLTIDNAKITLSNIFCKSLTRSSARGSIGEGNGGIWKDPSAIPGRRVGALGTSGFGLLRRPRFVGLRVVDRLSLSVFGEGGDLDARVS